MKVGLPVSIILMFFIWWFLTKVAFKMNKVGFPGGKKEINRLLNQMGSIGNEEKKILNLFIYRISNSPATPIPPPTHIVATPYFALRLLPSISRCPVILDPVIPYG